MKRIVLLFVLVIPASSLLAAEKSAGDSGKALHEQRCSACHKTDVYTNKKRKVKTLAALKVKVAGCAKANKTGWKAKQVDSVMEYLNSNFYKFSIFD